jgi:hypothetical protein
LPRWLVWLPFLVLIVHHWGWAPDVTQGDYAQYLSHARALVEGRAYGDIGYLYHSAAWSLGPAAYPPGLPLTMIPLVSVGGGGLLLPRLLMVVSLVVFGGIFTARLARDVPERFAVFAAAVAAYSIEASGRLLGPLSDPGFCALFWATILMAEHTEAWSRRRVAAVTLLGGFAMAYRLPGVALVPALVIFAIWHRGRTRWRPLIPVGLWSVAGVAALQLGALSLPQGASLRSTLFTLPSRIWGALSALVDGTRELLQFPLPWSMGNLVYHAAAMALMLAGLVWTFRRYQRTYLGAAVASYLMLLVAAPVSSARYYWPLWPMAMLVLLLGLQSVAQRVAPGATRAMPLLALAPLLSLPALLTRSAGPSLHGDAAGLELTSWIAQTAAATPVRIAFHNPRALTWLTRVPAMGLAERTGEGQLAAMMDHAITHLVLSRRLDGGCVEFIAAGLVSTRRDRFHEVWSNLDYRVFRLAVGPQPDSSSWRPIDWRNPAAVCPGGHR